MGKHFEEKEKKKKKKQKEREAARRREHLAEYERTSNAYKINNSEQFEKSIEITEAINRDMNNARSRSIYKLCKHIK